MREKIRTPDTLVRSQVLYPAELRTHINLMHFRAMPATGIEPVLYRYNRILSPARLPVPPHQHEMDGGGFEPPKQVAADLQSVPFGHSGIRPYETEDVLP